MNTNSQIVTDENIQIDKPELYLYSGCQVVNIYKTSDKAAPYSVIMKPPTKNEDHKHYWLNAHELTLKPSFEPEVGKYYQFSNWDDFLDYEISEFLRKSGDSYIDVSQEAFIYCRPIPKELKELFVFEE